MTWEGMTWNRSRSRRLRSARDSVLIRDRRGVMFSLIALLIGVFIFLLFWNANTAPLDVAQPAVEARVIVLDSYAASWESFVADAARLSLRLALLGLTEDRLQHNTTVLNPSQVQGNLSACLRTGSADLARPGAAFCFPGRDESLAARLNNFTSLAKNELGITTTYGLSDFTIDDWAPFEVVLGFTLDYVISDASFASWNRSRDYRVIVNVEGLPDPLFARYASGVMNPWYWARNITSYPVERDLLDRNGVMDLVATRRYVENRNLSPTYLERFMGNLTARDPRGIAGIETLVIPDTTTFSSAIWGNSSFTFHQLAWQSVSGETFVCSDETYRITGFTPPKLSLDVDHLARYNFNASSYAYSDCS